VEAAGSGLLAISEVAIAHRLVSRQRIRGVYETECVVSFHRSIEKMTRSIVFLYSYKIVPLQFDGENQG
jgi:hypothetical protein